jgi:hypothetical protein
MALDSFPKPLRLLGAISMTVIGVLGMLTPQSRLVGYLCLAVGVVALVRELAPKFWRRHTDS